ncbi:MAG: Lrp/AsnC family transcriptional regulator [Candidatus Woesearchaeota archaeon]
MKLDKYYRNILFSLTKNARIPLNELAKLINLSPSTTAYRIQQLQENNLLENTYAVLDLYKLGFVGYRAYITFQATTPDQEEEILSWLQKQKQAAVLLKTTGDVDCVCISWTKTDLEYYSFVQELKEHYQTHIKHIEITSYIKAHHLQRNYLLDEDDQEILTIGNTREIVEHDQLDLQILQLLATNARISALEIAQQLTIHAQTVINRIKRLEQTQVIAGYSCSINTQQLQRIYEKLNFVFSKNTNHQELLSYAASIPESIYVDEATNQYDLELNIEVSSTARKHEILNDIKNRFGGVHHFSQFSTTGFRKIVYLPV